MEREAIEKCCGHIHQADAGGFCTGCPDMHEHDYRVEQLFAEVPESIVFRCKECGQSLPT